MINLISEKTFDQERALYNLKNAEVLNCKFQGPADGESVLKECKQISVSGCSFSLRYPCLLYTSIFDSLINQFNTYKGIYLEVEKADESVINTIRRINFYKSLGAKKLDINYFYPNKDGCIELDLYFLPFCKAELPLKEVSFRVIKDVFNAVSYTHLLKASRYVLALGFNDISLKISSRVFIGAASGLFSKLILRSTKPNTFFL